MNIIERIRKFCFDIASLGNIAETIGGKMVAPLIAIPILLLGRLVLIFFPEGGWIVFLLYLLSVLLITQLAIKSPQAEYEVYGSAESEPSKSSGKSAILINKVLGLSVALIGVSFRFDNLKMVAFAIALFYLLGLLKPLASKQKEIRRVFELPGALGLLLSDVALGLLVNIIVRLASFL